MSDLKKLMDAVVSFRDERDWKQFHNPKDVALSLVLEAVEVMEHFQWKSKEEIEEYLKTNKEDVAEELADVLYWVLLFSSDLDIDIGFGEVDRNAIEVIKNSRVFKSAFSGFNKSVSAKLNEKIAKAFETPGGFSINKLVDDMSKVVDASRGRLERIARTESSNISNIARKNSYLKVDETGSEFLYKWIGPSDHRTTVYSKGVKKAVKSEGGAVTMKRLEELIKENGDSKIYSPQRPLTTHLNQRHTFIRVV